MADILRMLIECTVTMSIISLVLLLAMPFLSRRYSARGLYAVWMIVLLGFLIPLRPQVETPVVRVAVPAAQVWQVPVGGSPPAAQQGAPMEQPEKADVDLTAIPAIADQGAVAESAAQPKVRSIQISAAAVIVCIWAAGAVCALAISAHRHRQFMRSARRWRKPVRSAVCEEVLAAECARLGIRRPPTVYWCKSIDSPMLVGFFRPSILLPEVEVGRSALHLILRHELIHYRHGDLWGKLLLMVTSAVHWFNPFLPLIGREMAFHCEAACDARVTKGCDLDLRQYYSETILAMIRIMPGRTTALSTRYHGGIRTMKKRILSIMDLGRKRLGALVVAVILLAVLGTGMAFALTAQGTSVLDDEDFMRGVLVGTETTLDGELYEYMATANAHLRALVATYGDDEALADLPVDRLWFFHRLYNIEELQAALADMEACQSAEDLRRIYEKDTIQETMPMPEGLEAQVRALLDDAGHTDLIYMAYMESATQDEGMPIGVVYAYGDIPEGEEAAPYVNVSISADGKAMGIWPYRVDAAAQIRDITGTEKEQALAAAKAFCEGHVALKSPEAAVTMGSDLAIVSEGKEPRTNVWIYEETMLEEDSNPTLTWTRELNLDNPSNVYGMQLVIGTETGRVYAMSPKVTATAFANQTRAKADFMELTGQSLPYEDTQFMQDVVAPRIQDRMNEIVHLYVEDVSPEAANVSNHWFDRSSSREMPMPGSEWQRLDEALQACDSTEAFEALLLDAYEGINQSMPGMTSRQELEPYAKAALKVVGFEEDTSLSWVMLGRDWDDPSIGVYQLYGEHQIPLMYEGETWMGYEYLEIYLNTDGRITSMMRSQANSMGEAKVDVTQEERVLVAQAALDAANTVLKTGEGTRDAVYVGKEGLQLEGGQVLVEAWVYVSTSPTGTWDAETGTATPGDYGVYVKVDAKAGDVYSGTSLFPWQETGEALERVEM